MYAQINQFVQIEMQSSRKGETSENEKQSYVIILKYM